MIHLQQTATRNTHGFSFVLGKPEIEKDDRLPKDQLSVTRTDQEANKMGTKGMAGPVVRKWKWSALISSFSRQSPCNPHGTAKINRDE